MGAEQQFRRSLQKLLADGEAKKAFLRRAAISRSHLEKILAGGCSPRLDTAERLAAAAGSSLVDLLKSTPSR